MIETETRAERLLLRRPTPADLEAIYQVHAAPETNRFNPAGPMVSQAAAEAMLQAWTTHWDAHGFGYWAVAELERPEAVIGFGGIIGKVIDGVPTLNLYFRFLPAGWGRGLATELANAALDVAFNRLQAPEVVGLVRPANEPSIRVLTRLGMTLRGTLDDVTGAPPSLIYAMDGRQFGSKP